MPQFEQLQALWQAQPQPRSGAAARESLHRALRTYGRQQHAIRLVKIVLVGALLAFMTGRGHHSASFLAVLAAVALMAGLLIAMEWRAQSAIARLDFGDPSAAFIRGARARVAAQREPFRKIRWLFIGVLAAIDNLATFSPNRNAPALSRLGLHAFATLLPFAVYEAARRVRAWRFRRECGPILGRLDAVERSLQEDLR
jgi:hypothetical protein